MGATASLPSDERLRQKLARKMWAASYTGASYSTVDERGDAQDSDTLAGGALGIGALGATALVSRRSNG